MSHYKNNHFSETSHFPKKKKSLGQHFLRKQSTVDNMIGTVEINNSSSVLEIGCGDGFLTDSILKKSNCKKLVCYEIDPEWATVVRNKITDQRLEIRLKNILDVTTEELAADAPWTVLANLPYQITFPIFYLFQKNKALISEGVVMVQEEVAQKIVAPGGRAFNATSMFFQHHFTLKLMEKIEPEAFEPAPKVYSRLIYFKPKHDVAIIPDEDNFWKFLKLCFQFPRRTLSNNLRTTHYNAAQRLPEDLLKLRAQQLAFDDFLKIWKLLTQ